LGHGLTGNEVDPNGIRIEVSHRIGWKFLIASAVLFAILYLNSEVLGIGPASPYRWVGFAAFGLSVALVLALMSKRKIGSS